MRISIKLLGALLTLAIAMSGKADIDVYAETTGGLTGPQQLTNALAQALNGETLVIHPGRYDFTGICSGLRQYAWGPDLFWTNHIVITKAVKIRGMTDGHWNDEIVFVGNFTGIAIAEDVPVEISGITFEGFCGGTWETWDTSACGGAIRFARRWAEGDPNHGDATCLTNCVIRDCTSSNGGGIWGGLLVDCLVTGCTSTFMNAVGQDVRLVASTIAGNTSASDFMLQNPNGVYDCIFSNNTALSGPTIAFKGQSVTMPVSNTLFVANKATASFVTTGIVGFEDSSGKGDLRIQDCIFRSNSATGGSVCNLRSSDNLIVERCTFECNTNSVSADRPHEGGIACLLPVNAAGKLIVDGCRFTRNYSAYSVAGINAGIVSNTVFDANVSDNEGSCMLAKDGAEITIVGCTFINNSAAQGGGVMTTYWPSWDPSRSPGKISVFDSYFGANSSSAAGAVAYSYPTTQLSFHGCTFEGNSTPSGGGATFGPALASNCVFRSNTARYGGAMYYTGVAVDCTFEGNGGADCDGGTAGRSTLLRCKVSGGGFWYCSLLNCECRDISDKGGLYALYGANWATNCLFTMTGDSPLTAWGYIYRDWNAILDGYPQASSFVNCTFANITFPWTYFMMCDDQYPYQDSPDFYQTFENCIFSGNKNPNGDRVDFAYYTGKATSDYVKFRNCLYGNSAVLTSVENLGGNIVCDDAKFAKDSNSPRFAEAPAYSLQNQSPARDMGLTMEWMNESTDLQGNDRVFNVVDIGCYEFWPRNKGAIVIFR